MKKLLLFGFFLFLSGFVFGQNNAKISFNLSDNTLDIGTLQAKNGKSLHTIVCSNNGTTDLIIYSIQTTAGCEILTPTPLTIKPNKTSEIKFAYSLTKGTVRKTITIETNATNVVEGRVAIKLIGEVF